MDALKYFQEKARMTKADEKGRCTISCAHCPLFSHNHDEVSDSICGCFELACPEKAIAIVQKWSDEHPVKTFLQDLLEHYPNTQLYDGHPDFCPSDLGYESKISCGRIGCVECWNQPVKEG